MQSWLNKGKDSIAMGKDISETKHSVYSNWNIKHIILKDELLVTSFLIKFSCITFIYSVPIKKKCNFQALHMAKWWPSFPVIKSQSQSPFNSQKFSTFKQNPYAVIAHTFIQSYKYYSQIQGTNEYLMVKIYPRKPRQLHCWPCKDLTSWLSMWWVRKELTRRNQAQYVGCSAQTGCDD